MAAALGRVGLRIQSKLEFLNPIFVDIINESHKHNVPPNSESHFKGFTLMED
jgi:BolA family transcriptional regulator, general stress-responsive regulator